MSYNYLPLDHTPLKRMHVKNLIEYNQHVSITFAAHEKVMECYQYLQNILATDKVIYGVNTGFGFMSNVSISKEDTTTLQHNLLKSHACGQGNKMPIDIVKVMMMLKIKSLSMGYSGVQIDTIIRLLDMYNNGIIPVIYNQGSLGASGDLSPLSHLALPLIGEGHVYYKNEIRNTLDVYNELNWQPIKLQAKEGLALINGTQFMNAYGMCNILKAQKLLRWSEKIAALSLVAYGCKTEPFSLQIHSIRNHDGQKKVAANILKMITEPASDIKKQAVQDPYSFRCIPQVLGASWDAWLWAEKVFVDEMNSVTDNPNIFYKEDLILNGGNFHGQILGYAHELLGMAMAEVGNIAERRVFQLLSGQRGLPLFLTSNPGLNSGYMIPQYTAASLVNENKHLANPSVTDSIPSSNNQEDHVSMGAYSGVKTFKILENLEKILAIELLCAAQAIDLKKDIILKDELKNLHTKFRTQISFNEVDEYMKLRIDAAVCFLQNEK